MTPRLFPVLLQSQHSPWQGLPYFGSSSGSWGTLPGRALSPSATFCHCPQKAEGIPKPSVPWSWESCPGPFPARAASPSCYPEQEPASWGADAGFIEPLQWPSAAGWALNGAGGRQDSSSFPNLLQATSPTARKPGTTSQHLPGPPHGHRGLPSATSGVTSFLCIPDSAPAQSQRRSRCCCQRDVPRAREGHGWSNLQVFSIPCTSFGDKSSSCAGGQAPQRSGEWGTARVQSPRVGTQKPECPSLTVGFMDNPRPAADHNHCWAWEGTGTCWTSPELSVEGGAGVSQLFWGVASLHFSRDGAGGNPQNQGMDQDGRDP